MAKRILTRGNHVCARRVKLSRAMSFKNVSCDKEVEVVDTSRVLALNAASVTAIWECNARSRYFKDMDVWADQICSRVEYDYEDHFRAVRERERGWCMFILFLETVNIARIAGKCMILRFIVISHSHVHPPSSTIMMSNRTPKPLNNMCPTILEHGWRHGGKYFINNLIIPTLLHRFLDPFCVFFPIVFVQVGCFDVCRGASIGIVEKTAEVLDLCLRLRR